MIVTSSNQIMIQIIVAIILLGLGIYIFKTYPIKSDTKSIAIGAILIVLTAILQRLTIMVPLFGFESLKIGFAIIPIMLAGMILSPGYCYIIGLSCDLIGLIINPTGFPFLGFTLNSVLQAVIPALIVNKFKYQEKLEIFIKGGLIGLVLITTIYVFNLNSVTLAKNIIKLTFINKLFIIGLCSLMIIILFVVINILKKKVDDNQLHLFYTWVLAVIVVEVGVNFLLTPYWLQVMYNIPYMLSLFIRVIKACVMIPLDIIIGYSILKLLKRI